MTESELISKLNSLIRLDNDALSSYDRVINSLNDSIIRSEISTFRDDHKRHVTNLSDLVTKYKGIPSRDEGDVRGTFLAGATIVAGIAGIEGLLKALHSGEKLTNMNYSDAVTWKVPSDVLIILKENYEDEKKHLRFIESAIKDKIWEKR